MAQAKALVKVEQPYEDEEYKTVAVLMDSHNVLMHEVEDGGSFELSEYVEDVDEVKVGYYEVEYDWHEEIESWEMPNVKYPVIDEWDMVRTRTGWFQWVLISAWLFITRQNKYGY